MNKKYIVLAMALGSLFFYAVLAFGFTPEGEMREGSRTLMSGLGWVFLIVCMGVALVVPFLQQRRTRQALRILNEECDPARYIVLCQKECAKPRHRAQRLIWENNLAIGYQAAGDTERSLAMLRALRQKAPGQNKRIQWVLRANLADLLLDMGDLEHGGALYNQMRQEHALVGGDIPELLTRMHAKILVLQGEHQQAVDALLPLTHTGTPYMRCSVHHQLAGAYEKLGLEEARRDCLRFVASHGGELDIARRARRELAQL